MPPRRAVSGPDPGPERDPERMTLMLVMVLTPAHHFQTVRASMLLSISEFHRCSSITVLIEAHNVWHGDLQRHGLPDVRALHADSTGLLGRRRGDNLQQQRDHGRQLDPGALPVNVADMSWMQGCELIFMHLGRHLYQADCSRLACLNESSDVQCISLSRICSATMLS